MDRNNNFDYRNFFYPGGPAPLPVQIYPVSGGDPRFPFPFPFPPANMNMATAGGGRGGSASPSAREADITADADDQSPPPPPGSNSNSAVARRDTTAAAATTPPPKLDHVVQGLSHLLGDAIAFCEECLRAHREVTAAASFAGHATRNSLWRELLGARLEASGVHKDLLHGLVPRARRYAQQAQQAVAARRRGGGGGGGGGQAGGEEDEDGDEDYRLALVADKLAAQCGWVAQVNRRALGSSAACESMVETMREMLVLCGKMGPGGGGVAAQDGQEGGGGGY